MPHKTIRVLLLPEGQQGQWAAQCLEYDLASQGNSINDAILNFVQVINAQMRRDMERGIEPLSTKPEAPAWYWQALKEAEPLEKKRPLKVPQKARASKRAARLQAVQPFVLA
jgi:hypothetical protein